MCLAKTDAILAPILGKPYNHAAVYSVTTCTLPHMFTWSLWCVLGYFSGFIIHRTDKDYKCFLYCVYVIFLHAHMYYIYTGVTLIAKFCVNIAFFGCCTHFSQIAVTVCKMTTPIKQVTLHWWMPRHSTLDLLANSVSSQPFKSSQRRTESGQQNKCVTPHKLP